MIGPLRALVRIVLLGASAAALLALPVIPVSAQASNSSVKLACTITSTVDLHPGVTIEVRHIAATSHGFTGTATCTGTINGQPVTGPGTFRVDTQSMASCTSTSGKGSFGLKIPTADSLQTVTGNFAFKAAAAPAGATIFTGDLTGTGQVVSAVGDCFTTPVTRATAVDTVQVTA